MDLKSLPVFPIPIGLYNFEKENHDLNKALIDDIQNELDKDQQGQVRSNMGGWHSADDQEKYYDS